MQCADTHQRHQHPGPQDYAQPFGVGIAFAAEEPAGLPQQPLRPLRELADGVHRGGPHHRHWVAGEGRKRAITKAREARIRRIAGGAVRIAIAEQGLGPLLRSATKSVMATAASQGEALADMLAEKQPSRRLSSPEEIARLARWLCAPEAHNITGTALPIDGGWTAQ